MDDAEETVTLRRLSDTDLAAGSWTESRLGDPDPGGGPAVDAAVGLASLSFITAAIRRRTRFWCLAGVLGLLLGAGLYVAHPPKVVATTEMLLELGPNEDLNTAIDTDAALATSLPVAEAALQKLGLNESTSAFLSSYTATGVTNRVLQIAVSASSPNEAVRRANALAQAFLAFRAKQLLAYQNLTIGPLEQDVNTNKARVAALQTRVDALTGLTSRTPEQNQQLTSLTAQLNNARGTLSVLVQSARSTQQTVTAVTNTAVHGSHIINPGSAVVKSRIKTAIIYAFTGMLGFLFISIGIVAVSALLSDKLRRRDDVAQALGVPVQLSTGRVRPRRARTLAAASQPEIQRIAGHLASLLPDNAAESGRAPHGRAGGGADRPAGNPRAGPGDASGGQGRAGRASHPGRPDARGTGRPAAWGQGPWTASGPRGRAAADRICGRTRHYPAVRAAPARRGANGGRGAGGRGANGGRGTERRVGVLRPAAEPGAPGPDARRGPSGELGASGGRAGNHGPVDVDPGAGGG